MEMTAKMTSVYIIAEAGVNHNGCLETALKLVDAAVIAKADAIKFQSFKAENLVTKQAEKAQYQKKNQNDGKTQLEMLKALELSEKAQITLYQYCHQHKIDFLSSPFDPDSCAFLIEQLQLKTIKLGSGELTNAQLLYQLAQADRQVILSTGMSTVEEISQALSLLAYGYNNKLPPSGTADYIDYQKTSQGQHALKKNVTLMHCTTEYPCPVNEVNLSAMQTLEKQFALPCGYSDHTENIHISIAAAALGAPLIEKHFTLDRNQTGPDHRASIEPEELIRLVAQIRDIEQAIGNGIKQVAHSESANKIIARKGVYAARSIQQGNTLSCENLILKRPAAQHCASEFWDLIGTTATKDYLPDSPI